MKKLNFASTVTDDAKSRYCIHEISPHFWRRERVVPGEGQPGQEYPVLEGRGLRARDGGLPLEEVVLGHGPGHDALGGGLAQGLVLRHETAESGGRHDGAQKYVQSDFEFDLISIEERENDMRKGFRLRWQQNVDGKGFAVPLCIFASKEFILKVFST